METPVASPKAALRAITVFFYAVVGGLSIFTIIVFGLNILQSHLLVDKDTAKIFLEAVIIIATTSILAANYLYKKRIAEIRSQQLTLLNKLTMYRAALIFYLALCEGGGLFAVIVYFLTGNMLLLIVVAVVLLAMLQNGQKNLKFLTNYN